MGDKVAFDLSWSAAINEAAFFSRPLARFLARVRTQLIAAVIVAGCLSIGVLGFIVERNMRVQNLQTQRFDSIRDWALSSRAGTEREIEDMFRLASRMRVDEAVPKAVLYAVRKARNDDGTHRFHVMAARDFLSGYAFEDIERIVRRDAVQFTDPDDVLRQLREVLVQ